MDISGTLAPTSDQLDAIELLAGPRTFVIERVTMGSQEQPVNVHLVDFPRPWRPSKGMRRMLVAGWGADASTWTGKRVTLFLDPEVTFGKEKPGGTRIKAMSDLPDGKPLRVPLLVTRGKSAIFTVQPLVESARPTAPMPDVSTITDRAVLKDLWRTADQQTRAAIKARVDQLDAAPADDPLDYSGDLLDEGGAL